LCELTVEQLKVELGEPTGGTLFQRINDLKDVAARKLPSRMEHLAHDFKVALANSSRSALDLDRGDFEQLPSWGQVDLFQQSFGELFASYRNMWLKNQLAQRAVERGRTDTDFLTDAEFEERYMLPPWQFVNDALRSARLPFEISKPDEFSFAPFQPRLTKVSSKADVGFNDLSSGEKILMSLAFCVYYAQDKRQVATKPKLLLLDEVDAPLHPSMARTFLGTIMDTIVAEHGIPVIAATHSASTVAMAPESSLYIMDERRRPVKGFKNRSVEPPHGGRPNPVTLLRRSPSSFCREPERRASL
jgi:hypothetical protein